MSNTITRPQSDADKLKSAANQAGQTAQDTANTAGQKAQDAANTAGQKAQDFARGTGQKVQEAANTVGQKAHELASTVGQKAQEFVQAGEQKAMDAAHTASQKVQETAQTVGHKAEDATAALGSGLQTAAGKVRQALPHEGMLGQASEAVAGALERGGHYIEEKNIRGMADDVTEVIKKNPIPAVLIAAGVGFLLGRSLRS